MESLSGEVLHWGLLLTSTAGLEKHEKKKSVSLHTQAFLILAVLWDKIIRLFAKNWPQCKHTLASYTITQHAAEQAFRPSALATRKLKARQDSDERGISTAFEGTIMMACFEETILKAKLIL